MNSLELWQRFQDCRCEIPALDLVLDYSRMRFDDGFFARLEPALQAAYDAVAALEAGGIANPDEQRMVGHYWLRNADLAPTPEIREAITGTVAAIQRFAADIPAA